MTNLFILVIPSSSYLTPLGIIQFVKGVGEKDGRQKNPNNLTHINIHYCIKCNKMLRNTGAGAEAVQ